MITNELLNIIRDEGYAARIKEKGAILFKAQGRYMFVTVDESDESFISLFTVCSVEPEGSQTELHAYSAANAISAGFQCVKCNYLWTDEVGFVFRIAVEMFSSPQNFRNNIQNYIDVISACGESLIDNLSTY